MQSFDFVQEVFKANFITTVNDARCYKLKLCFNWGNKTRNRQEI